MRHRYLSLCLVTLLGAAVAVLPAIASSETPPTVSAVSAGSSGIYETFAWSPQATTVTAGGSVIFSNGSATVEHGIVWTGSVKPTCASSVPQGERSGVNWSGSCSFAQAGKYAFYCSVHGPSMSGTITVDAAGTTTVTTTPSQPGAGTPTGTPPAGPPSETAPPLSAVVLGDSQRGTSVRGSVHIGQAGSRLEVDLVSSGLRVGRLVKHASAAGKLSFTVALSARAKRALKRKGTLKVQVKLIVTPLGGSSTSSTHRVTLRVHH